MQFAPPDPAAVQKQIDEIRKEIDAKARIRATSEAKAQAECDLIDLDIARACAQLEMLLGLLKRLDRKIIS